jgi:hypothetical protein
VFAWAFALGVVRTLVVAPRVGDTAAVLIETPLVLAASWLASRWTVRRLAVGSSAAERLAMGAVAFALLMEAELGLSLAIFGRPAHVWLASLITTPGAIGLTAQVAFGFVPLVQRATRRP